MFHYILGSNFSDKAIYIELFFCSKATNSNEQNLQTQWLLQQINQYNRPVISNEHKTVSMIQMIYDRIDEND